MNIRKVTSLTALLSFIFMLMTAIILYIVPQGRVAYWADWHLWGLTKTQWGAIHINLGLLFILSILLHIYYNWKPILAYLKNKARRIIVFTREFSAALVIVVIFVVGTYIEIPPFSSFLALSDSIKAAAAEKYGEPPYGHAELSSLKIFTRRIGYDTQKSIEALKKAGYRVEDDMQTVADIGRLNGITPQQVYVAMLPAAETASHQAVASPKLPDSPPAGTGSLTLAELCSRYKLDTNDVLLGLAGQNIRGSADATIKNIAADNRMSPIDVYEQIKTLAAEKGQGQRKKP